MVVVDVELSWVTRQSLHESLSGPQTGEIHHLCNDAGIVAN